MKIAYFTSAQNSKDFDSFQRTWTVPLNTSSQVFNNRLIRSLALSNEVKVYSARPYKKGRVTNKTYPESKREEKHISWKYLPIERFKFLSFIKQIKIILFKKTNEPKPDIVIADCNHARSLSLAFAYAKKNKLPLVGVLDDNPSSVSDITPFKAKFISSLAKRCNAFICITEALNKLVNTKKKPHLQIDGVTEDVFRLTEVDLRKYKRFFFYSGALSERYGIYNLIEAFKQLNYRDISLIICGYHKEERLDDAVEGARNIYYIGTLPNEICLAYESKSVANINPKSYDPELDKYSVPSKTIEYLSATSLTISTYIENLYSDFQYDALWVKDGYSLKEAMEDALNMKPKDREEMIMEANIKANEKYSLKANNKKLDTFLDKLIK